MEEIFKEYEFGNMKYQVGNMGTIIGARGKLKQRLNKDGYLQVTMGATGKRTSKPVHRVVAEVFVPNPNNLPEVNHIDRNRQNPIHTNLEWTSHQDNVAHSAKVGAYSRCGERNSRAIFTREQVEKIRKLYDEGMRVFEICKLYNAKWSTVDYIVKRKSWN